MVDHEGLKLLRSRRTIRRFTNEDVSTEALQSLLDAASIAPSRLDRRPLYFLVIRDKVTKARACYALGPEYDILGA